ncbi:MAG: hypothetical protein ABR601_00420 [Parasphingopyxis sp.]|nr:hypothetical protein [Sphingomonadales bacterium]
MIRPASVPIIALLALAACSGGEEEQEAPAADPAAIEAEPVALEAMPEEFRGRWDFAIEDCDDPASEMRLEIGADEVQFYESSADLTAIERTGETSLTVDHHFTGEGEEWNETLGYELSEDGERLTVSTPEGSLSIRMRCPV